MSANPIASGPRTITQGGNGQSTVSIELPPIVGFTPESVRVVVDNSGGGPVTATLDIAEQSGVVIATKRQGETIDAGTNPGSATWALRLDDEGSGSSPSGSHMYETFRDAVGVLVAPNTATTLKWVHDFGANVMQTGVTTTSALATGGFVFSLMAQPLSGAAAPYSVKINFRLAINGTFNFQTAATQVPIFGGGLGNSGVAFGAARDLAAGNTCDVRLTHNAAGNVTFGLYGGVLYVP